MYKGATKSELTLNDICVVVLTITYLRDLYEYKQVVGRLKRLLYVFCILLSRLEKNYSRYGIIYHFLSICSH